VSGVSAAELYRWGALDEKRRRRARGVTRILSPMVLALLAAAAIAGLVASMVSARSGAGAVRLALAAIATANVVVVFGTLYRMYWRTDSALLGRLPIPGGVLFRLALARSLRAAGLALLPALAAPVAILAFGGLDIALRLGIVAAASALVAGLLAPAACLAAGGLVASDKAQAVLDSFGGEFRPPKVSWLGTLPGLVATAVALLGIIAAPWVRLERELTAAPLVLCVVAGVASIAAIAWALGAADRVLILAQREIAALDQERLAHIDRSRAGPLERVWAVVFAGDSARAVYDKDAALMRRRYPAPYFVAFVGVGLAWIFAATGEHGTAVAAVFSLAAYSLVMARRLVVPPVEHPRLLRSLPLARGAAARAKRAAVLLRSLFWCGVSGAALVVFGEDMAVSIGLASAALVISAIGGALLVGSE
jgi:hypothetical protein